MKSALLLEQDGMARAHTARLLKSLGYLVATAATPALALGMAEAVRFDAVLTCTDFHADDRRSLRSGHGGGRAGARRRAAALAAAPVGTPRASRARAVVACAGFPARPR
jgi:CheY-like chemotaxis protein